MELHSDSIISQTLSKPVIESNLSNVESGKEVSIYGSVDVAGVTTTSSTLSTNANVSGIVTATSFVGGGSNLTNTTGNNVTGGYINAVRLIIQDPPLRA